MPAELDNIDSEMDQPEMDQPEMDSEPVGGTIGLHGGETDREGAMAKADLFKIANYAHKLYQQLEDNDQLESWVQAKITKAADYIASVYHYLEYEMKFSEYGHHLDNSDTLSEGQKMRIKELLSEAKSKVKELKKAQAEKVSEEKSSTGGEIDRSTKGVTKHKENPNRFSDEEHTEPKSNAKSQSAADKEGNKAADKAEEKEGKNWEKRFGKDSVTRVKDGKKVDEALKGGQKKLDKNHNGKLDGDDFKKLRGGVKETAISGAPQKSGIPTTATTTVPGMRATGADLKKAGASAAMGEGKCNHTPKDKKCPVHGLKECGMYEAKKKGDGNLANNAKPYDKVTRGDVIAGRIGKDEKGGKKVKEDTPTGAGAPAPMSAWEKTKSLGSAMVPGLKNAAMTYGAMKAVGVKEAAKQTMSRAAKGHEKYGKEGMAALAKAGKEGKSLEPVKAKYNKYDESVESGDKKPCPPMSHVKKMCNDGKSVSEICKMHPDCDHSKLKKMIADCKKQTVKETDDKMVAAAIWRNMKETTAYMAERKKKEKVTDENLVVVPNPSGAKDAEEAKKLGAMMPAPAGKKDPISEGNDLARMRELTGRLNRTEQPALVENREVDQIRALTKRLLG